MPAAEAAGSTGVFRNWSDVSMTSSAAAGNTKPNGINGWLTSGVAWLIWRNKQK